MSRQFQTLKVFLITINSNEWVANDDNGNHYSVSKGDFTLQIGNDIVFLDVIFNSIHGAPGENGQLAALWELLNIPFSSCDSYTSALTYNKRDCLSVLREINIPTAKHFSIDRNDKIDLEKIEKAVIMKEDWSIENGLMTPTLKIKRSHVEKIHMPMYRSWFDAEGRILYE